MNLLAKVMHIFLRIQVCLQTVQILRRLIYRLVMQPFSMQMKWELMEDHRGKTVYETKTGAAIYISELGALSPDVTAISPEGDYQKWNGNAWVNDENAERDALVRAAESQKKEQIAYAGEIIATLQDAVDLDMATEEEKLSLTHWKKYRVLLNRIQPEDAPDIEWPEMPQ